MQNKFIGEQYRSTTICIDSYNGKIPVGRIYNKCLPEGKAFTGVTRFLLEMEKLLDKIGLPKAFSELRVFTPPGDDEVCEAAGRIKKGAVATFMIRIMFRQNAGWQGSLKWIEGQQEQCFRSVLELILLMDSALSYRMSS